MREPKEKNQSMGNERYLFGPVPSRRFGRSLGVDLTPFKTCSLNCVFCQLGRTTNKTVTRKKYVPTNKVIAELDAWLKTDGTADYITLSGSGEPTLHEDFGEVLAYIHNNSDIPAVLLTNGTLLHLPDVRDAASRADVVKISLSAWDQASFGWVNRPHAQLFFEEMIQGQKAFRRQFKGKIWLEVFLVSGMNSMPSDVSRIAALVNEIKPDRVHLNTVVRPAAEDFAEAVSSERLTSLCELFRPTAEIIVDHRIKQDHPIVVNENRLLAILQRRPCTADQLAVGGNMHLNEVAKYLGNMMRIGMIKAKKRENSVYYVAALQKGKDNYHSLKKV